MQNNEYNSAVKHFFNHDVLIYKLMSNFEPLQLKLKRRYFHALVTSIIGQQLSVNSAKAIINRFNIYFDKRIDPHEVINTDIKVLRKIGLSAAKSNYVTDLSKKIISGEVKLKGISSKSNDEIMTELCKVKGIGPWTVHMFLIFVLGRPNILPVGDLGIKRAIMLNYNLKKLPTTEHVLKIAKNNNWEPYSTYASMYLWKSIDTN